MSNRRDRSGDVVSLADDFGMWRHVRLRSTTFPAADLERLASPRLVAAAHELIDARERARAALPGDRKRHRRLDSWEPLAAEQLEPVSAYSTALGRFLELYEASVQAHEISLRELGQDARLREAIAWQGPDQFETLERFIQARPIKKAKLRWLADKLELYCVRYHVRCETIGFFGPVMWMEVEDSPTHVRSQAGPLAAERRVLFEPFAVQHLADWLSDVPAIRERIPPRRSSRVLVARNEVVFDDGRQEPVSDQERALLDRCDGTSAARDIVDACVAAGVFASAERGLQLLADLAGRSIVAWTLHVAGHVEGLERLRSWMAEANADGSLDRYMEPVRDLEQVRSALAASAGQPENVASTLRDAADRLQATTGRQPSAPRSRPVAYHECLRGGETALGTRFLETLAAPLGLLLSSTRWLTHRFSLAARDHLNQLFGSIARESAASPIAAARFYDAIDVAPLVTMARQLRNEFAQMWWKILGRPDGEASVQRDASELRAQVSSMFAAPGPGWIGAQFTSPDLMVAARDLASFAGGDYLVVLSECHLGYTATSRCAVWAHPDPQRLRQALSESLPDGLVEPIPWRFGDHRLEPRRLPAHELFGGSTWIRLDDSIQDVPLARTLPIGSLVVDSEQGTLVVRDREGSIRIDILDLVWHKLTFAIGERIWFSPQEMTVRPRITIDRFVLSRGSWLLATGAPSTAGLTAARRYLELTQWSRALGVPRHVFASSPLEKKPILVDFANPSSVRRLGAMVDEARGSSIETITVTEMLPAPGQLWLEDASGRRYCSELRTTCVDRNPPAGRTPPVLP